MQYTREPKYVLDKTLLFSGALAQTLHRNEFVVRLAQAHKRLLDSEQLELHLAAEVAFD